MKKDQLTIVIPCYNEEESLKENINKLVEFAQINSFNLIFVNDGSNDGTQKILDNFKSNENVKIIEHIINRGYGAALKSGIFAADTDYVITMDADGQHNMNDIKIFYELIKNNRADLIVGKREKSKSDSAYRSIGKFLIRKLANYLVPSKITDINSGFKIYRTSLAKKYIQLCPDSMAFSDVITLIFVSQKHFVLEQNIKTNPRIKGSSTISTKTAFETVIEILNIVMFFNPLKIFITISVFFIACGILWGLPILLKGKGISIGASLLINTGLIFSLLGLISEQLSLIRKQLIRDVQINSENNKSENN